MSLADRDALSAYRQAQRDLADEQHQVSQLNVGARLQTALLEHDARGQFRALWKQHQVDQTREQQLHDQAERAAAAFRRQLDAQREAEQARQRERDLERERERERSGPSLG